MKNGLENSYKLSIKGETTTGPVGLFGQYVVGGVVGNEAQGGICAVVCGQSISVDDNGVGVIMCLLDMRSEVVLDPLPDGVFIGFLGVIEIEMNAVFEKVDDVIARLAFVIG